MSDPIRVLLIDDHRLFAQALDLLLASEEDIETVGTAESAEEGLDLARSDCPDVVLMDIDLPGMDGIEATRRLAGICPDTHVVAITALQPGEVMAMAVEAGACGFVPKTQAADQLVGVIRSAARGEMVLPSRDAGSALIRLSEARRARSDADLLLRQLTEREVEILQGLADGKSTSELAGTLFISPHTVDSHVKSILAKLGVHSKLGAVLFGLRHGRIELRSVS